MLRKITVGLCLALVWAASAGAQETPPDKINWITGPEALRSAFSQGSDGKPVIFWLNARPNLAEKLGKANLGDKTVIKLSKEFHCARYDVNPKGDMAYEMLKRQGLGEYEGKVTFFDPSKIDQSVRPDFRDPKAMKKFFKEIKKGIIWQLKPNTHQRTLAKGMHNILKKMGRLPKKTKEEDNGKKVPGGAGDQADEKKSEQPKVDPARNLFERGQSFEKNSKFYAAWKAYMKAKQHDTAYGQKSVAAIKRLEGDKAITRIIAQERQDEQASAWLSLGKSFQKNEKWKLAAQYYGRILKRFPNCKHAPEAKSRLEVVNSKLEGEGE